MLNRAPARPQFLRIAFALVAMAIASACVSDYRGWLGHQTESEAKLWGNEASLIVTPDPDGFSGTYASTVKYDFRGYRSLPAAGTCPDISPDPANPPAACTYPDEIDINIYYNPTVGAFSRDGCVDRDGDDLQQRPGIQPGSTCENAQPSATKFEPKFLFEDGNLGCQFFANYSKTYGSPKVVPAVAVCFNSPSEEVDKDLSLQGSASSNLKEAFTDLDDLFNKIWSGALATKFTAEVTSVTINGNTVAITPMSLALSRNNLRIINYTLDLTTPGGKDFVGALLANTESGQPAALAFHFDGGLTFRVPSSFVITFDHASLKKIL